MLNIFGGKITTYRCLVEDALQKVADFLPELPGNWTAGVALPRGDFGVSEVSEQITKLRSAYPLLSKRWAIRLIKAYDTDAFTILADTTFKDDLGHDFGATLS